MDGTDGTSQLEENCVIWRFVIWLAYKIRQCHFDAVQMENHQVVHPPVELLPLWLLRPWLHCFSLQSRITKADREKHSWSSDGNTKVKKAHGKVVCVYLDSKRINNWDVDSVLIT